MRKFIAALGAILLLPLCSVASEVDSLKRQGFSNVSFTSFSGKELRGSADPGQLIDLTVVVLTGGQWTAENVKANLKRVDAIYAKCGMGLGRVTMYTAKAPTKTFTDLGLRCTRFLTKGVREFRCAGGGPDNPKLKQSIQGLAQMTAALPRPTIHFIDNYEGGIGVSAAYSERFENRTKRPWTEKLELSAPISEAEAKNATYFNNVLGTAFVANNLELSKDDITPGLPKSINDPMLAVRAAHEIGHLLGADHDDPKDSFMNAEPTASEASKDLCKSLHASQLLRASAKAAPDDPKQTKGEH